MKKSRKGKKYNPRTVARLNHEYAKNEPALKQMLVAYHIKETDKGSRDALLVDYNGKLVSITQRIADMMTDRPYAWSVLLCVFCVEKGEKTTKRELAVFNGRHYQANLVHALNEQHEAFIEKHKSKNVTITGYGWLASPTNHQFDCEKETGRIFIELGAI